MGLTLCLLIISLFRNCLCFPFEVNPFGSNNTNIQLQCPDYGKIEHAKVKTYPLENFVVIVHVECEYGYEFDGKEKLFRITCKNGKWDNVPRPKCVPKDVCTDPLGIDNGIITIEGDKDTRGFYNKGTLVTYTCNEGYRLSPPESKYRVCEKTIWTGAMGKCILMGCESPKEIKNGYFVLDKNGVDQDIYLDQRVYYTCSPGYVLKGPPMQQCNDGSWIPRIPPFCAPLEINVEDNGEFTCKKLPALSHVEEKVLRGEVAFGNSAPGTEIALRCAPGYINAASATSCEPVILRCAAHGVWIGDLPSCELAKECVSPPSVPNSILLGRSPSGRYPIGSQVSYDCLEGFIFRGERRLQCAATACWEGLVPTCHPTPQFLDEYMTASDTLLVSMATAVGVMLMLLGVCLVVTCRRRKPWFGSRDASRQSRPSETTASVSVSAADSTAALIDDPDRLALIAFADGLQAGQNAGLPSYEEAIRERSCAPGLLGYRPHRPHWPALGGRRGRGTSVSAGDTLITRQSSCTSHSASMRSGSAGGDPMGSTDTMTPSEVSTNVTLDTVSSHSGSQPASCRAICGSLASFDTSSVLNTEGVPLLEENETEETPSAETRSIALSDNSSFKNNRTSPDLV